MVYRNSGWLKVKGGKSKALEIVFAAKAKGGVGKGKNYRSGKAIMY